MNCKSSFYLIFIVMIFLSYSDKKNEKKVVENKNSAVTETKIIEESEAINIIPIEHASMILEKNNVVIYVDPVGGSTRYNEQPTATIVLVTDIHGDHLNIETLEGVVKKQTQLLVPMAVAAQLPEALKNKATIINNDETKTLLENVSVEAIPMYNLREEALKFHEKGRGNGYVINWDNERIYISGDTEDIPEMRALKNIDKAFVCMNLPYTMTVESAASAVLDFKPKLVYPYHYRGPKGLSDIEHFKNIVNKGDEAIEVTFLDWYPKP
ncbi:MBL fold metallo-hydrolase [Flavobacterium sp. ASW18X]|uniref:MBL fold metallo-hydrolase n=1 Tax=Flavobacterium sp. ASW18X TaxID=2572595 RepID=UPI0010AE1411|nr:MBL fold metallo-hydrolase [Flavobacterium sp. ASW18X]TKD66208.1 MBL fold metallo-hydrolase [Flavobacterium sp. ASW18X]